jgi:hypothetical protein
MSITKLSLNYSRPGIVWLVTSQLGMGKLQTFFDSVAYLGSTYTVQYTVAVPSTDRRNSTIKKVVIFPSSAGMSLTKLYLAGSLVSDMPSGDGKTANLFLQCPR